MKATSQPVMRLERRGRIKLLYEAYLAIKADAAAAAEVRLYNIGPLIGFTQTLVAHWYGILNFVESHLANGLLEAVNPKIQLAKRRARAYRDTNNYLNMIYFLCAKLKFDYPPKFI